MKILLKINILLSLLLLMCCELANAQTNGFIGSKNSLSLDVSSLMWQEIHVQYNVHIKKHQVLTIDFSRQDITDDVLYNQEGDSLQVNFIHGNNSVGIGFLMNNSKLKMPMPIGFYYGLHYQRHWGKLNQDIEGLILDTYHHRSNLPMIILGRGMALSPKLFIDLSVNTGIKFGKYFLLDEALFDIPPLVVYPHTLPFVKSNIKLTEKQKNEFTFRTFYAMPSIKLGFLF